MACGRGGANEEARALLGEMMNDSNNGTISRGTTASGTHKGQQLSGVLFDRILEGQLRAGDWEAVASFAEIAHSLDQFSNAASYNR